MPDITLTPADTASLAVDDALLVLAVTAAAIDSDDADVIASVMSATQDMGSAELRNLVAVLAVSATALIDAGITQDWSGSTRDEVVARLIVGLRMTLPGHPGID